MTASEKLQRVLIGIVAGGALWMLMMWMGIPHIFGLPAEVGLIPFLVSGAALALTRFHRLPLYAAALLFAFTIVVGYTTLFVRAERSLIRSDPLPQSADAVVVLSAGLNADGYLSRDGMERLLSGLELVKRGIAPRIIVTEERRIDGIYRYSSGPDQRRLASLAGVANLISTGPVKNTHEEAVQVAKVANANHWRRVIVVTHPFHTSRACATFEKTGLTVSCVPSITREIGVSRLSAPRDRVEAFGLWLYERAGTMWYRHKGWL